MKENEKLAKEINSIEGIEAKARPEDDYIILEIPGVWPEFEKRAKERAERNGHKVDWPGIHAAAKEEQNRRRYRISGKLKNHFKDRFTKRVTRTTSYWKIDETEILRDIVNPKPSKIVVHNDGSYSHRQH